MGEEGVWIQISNRPPIHVMHEATARRLLEHEGGRLIPDPTKQQEQEVLSPDAQELERTSPRGVKDAKVIHKHPKER